MPLTGEAKKLYNKKYYESKNKVVEELNDIARHKEEVHSDHDHDHDNYVIDRSFRIAKTEESYAPIKRLKEMGYTASEVVKMIV